MISLFHRHMENECCIPVFMYKNITQHTVYIIAKGYVYNITKITETLSINTCANLNGETVFVSACVIECTSLKFVHNSRYASADTRAQVNRYACTGASIHTNAHVFAHSHNTSAYPVTIVNLPSIK